MQTKNWEEFEYQPLETLRQFIPAAPFESVETAYPWLAVAVWNKDLALVSLFLKHPLIDPSNLESSVLALAIMNKDAAMVRMLLHDRRIQPGARDNEYLKRAILERNNEILQLFLYDWRIRPNQNNGDLLRTTALVGESKAIQLLLGHPRIHPAFGGEEALEIAARSGHAAILELLLQDGRIEPTHQGFQYAIESGSVRCVKLFLQHRNFDPTFNGGQALKLAVEESTLQIVKALVQDGRIHTLPAFLEAVKAQRADMVDALLSKSEELDVTSNQFIAFKSAAKSRDEWMLTMLLHRYAQDQIERGRQVCMGCMSFASYILREQDALNHLATDPQIYLQQKWNIFRGSVELIQRRTLQYVWRPESRFVQAIGSRWPSKDL